MATLGATQPRTLSSFRAKRTEALPRHSLFGTALENVDKTELQGIDASEADKIGVKLAQQRYPIPEQLQGQVSARTMVDKVRSDISCQNQVVADAQKQLKDKESKALSFKPDAKGKEERAKSREHVWLTKEDLQHSSDINIVGLSKTGSYNRDKYGNKPATHNYSLIGDPLIKGNEFGQPQRFETDDTLLSMNQSENNNLGAIRLGWNPRVDPDKEIPLKPKSAVKLPPNIRHQFGSRVCDSLLADEKKVAETLEKQKGELRSSLAPPGVDAKDYGVKASGSYFDVGHVTRYNIFPGHSMLDQNSTMKASHNDVVYMRREPMVNEHRMIKDGYVRWREQFLLNKRMEEQWSHFFKSQPKLSANWDRTQTRPQPAIQTAPVRPSKPKPKPKPKGKRQAAAEPLFEEVVFITPPVTPPPQPPSPAKLPATVQRDDEFWSFYDKGSAK